MSEPSHELERLKAAIVRIHSLLEKGDIKGAMECLDAKRLYGPVAEEVDAEKVDAYDMSTEFFAICAKRGIERAAYVALIPHEEGTKVLVAGEDFVGRMLSDCINQYLGKATE